MRKLAAALAMLFSLSLPFSALAVFNVESSGLDETAKSAYGEAIVNEETSNVGLFVGKYIIKPVIGLTGIIFLVLTVYAGVLWMTSRGDTKQVDKAKTILVNSVIGVIIIASAYILTDFVIGNLTPTGPAALTPANTDYV